MRLCLGRWYTHSARCIPRLTPYPRWSCRAGVTAQGDDEDQGIQHTLLPIPRIPLRELYQPHNTEFARGLRPFVLTEAMQDAAWTRARRTWSADYFAERFPDSVTDFYPHNMDNEKVRPFLTRWTEALREYKVPSDKFPHRQGRTCGTRVSCPGGAHPPPPASCARQPHPSGHIHPVEPWRGGVGVAA